MHATGTWDPRAVGLGLLIGYGRAAAVRPALGAATFWSSHGQRERRRLRFEAVPS